MGKARLVLVAASVLALCSAGCARGSRPPSTEVVPRSQPGVVRVGTSADYPPFTSETGGTFEGFEVDLGQAMASKMRVKWVIVPTPVDGLPGGLEAGRFDAIMSALPITAQRSAQMDASSPYMANDQAIIVTTKSPIKNAKGLKGKRVGVEIDSRGQAEASKLLGPGGPGLKKYTDVVVAVDDLKAGGVDAVIGDMPVTSYVIRTRYPGAMKVIATIPTGESYTVWVRKGDAALLDAINKALADVKADGTYREIYARWFGEPPVR